MKITGFSLIELLTVLLITAIMLTFGFNAYTDSKSKAEIQLDQQYLLQLPTLVENYFSEQLEYPDSLNDFLTPQNGELSTPKKYYTIEYILNDNSYLFTATANTNPMNTYLANCNKLLIYSSGQLEAFDTENNYTSEECWN